MNGMDSISSQALKDSLIRESVKYAGRKYYLKEMGEYATVFKEAVYRRGHIPAGIYIEYYRCHYAVSDKLHKYEIKGYYNRKGEKDGIWKRYEPCTGLFFYKEFFKNGERIWWSSDF